MTFNVQSLNPFKVNIEKTHGSYIGLYDSVSVNVNFAGDKMGGFDMLVAYDASALTFQKATQPGSIYERLRLGSTSPIAYGPAGNCAGGCPAGLLRVAGIRRDQQRRRPPDRATRPRHRARPLCARTSWFHRHAALSSASTCRIRLLLAGSR